MLKTCWIIKVSQLAFHIIIKWIGCSLRFERPLSELKIDNKVWKTAAKMTFSAYTKDIEIRCSLWHVLHHISMGALFSHLTDPAGGLPAVCYKRALAKTTWMTSVAVFVSLPTRKRLHKLWLGHGIESVVDPQSITDLIHAYCLQLKTRD